MEEFFGGGVADEAEEVTGGGVEEAEWGRVLLAFGLVGVVADGLEAEHCDDVFIFLAAGFCVDETAHLVGLEEGCFFVGEENEAEGFVGFFVCEAAGECEIGGDCGGVIVGTWRAEDGVVMCADDYDLVGVLLTGVFRFDVVAGLAFGDVVLSAWGVAGVGE